MGVGVRILGWVSLPEALTLLRSKKRGLVVVRGKRIGREGATELIHPWIIIITVSKDP